MNNNMLISTAMLNAFWEKEKKDTLDLLLPFIKYSIAKTTKVKSEIDMQAMTAYFVDEFGYDTIPPKVVELMLNRLCPKILKKKHGKYTLMVSLDEDVYRFEKGHTRFMEQRNKVAVSLKNYLNEKLVLRTMYDEDSAMKELIAFFATNGMCILQDTILLDLFKKKDDKIRYNIAQFILDEFKKKSEIFSYVEEMVKGLFVSTAISLQPQNSSVTQAKFKDLQCYLDTRIIMSALDILLAEEKASSIQMIEMLKDKGAKLYCFEHTLREINEIITAYKYGLQNPRKNSSCNTLQGWDEREYTVTDVERFQSVLSSKIEALGIEIISRPSFEDKEKYPFNDNDFSDFIKENMRYKNEDALTKDIQSIASIFLIRDGSKTLQIEKSKAIFVTPNIHLVNTTNAFLLNDKICDFDNEFTPIISDIDLSSIVWLKCYTTNKDYPVQRLIEHSLIALEPTPTMLQTFFEMVDRIAAEGGITEDEATIIRSDVFCRKELSNTIKGDVSSITDDTIYDIRDKLKKKYIGDAEQKSELNYKKYLDAKKQKREIKIKALTKIRDERDKIYKRLSNILTVFAWVLIGALFAAFVVISVINAVRTNDFCLGTIVLLAFSVVGTLDMLWAKTRYIKRLINYLATAIADNKADKKKTEYEEFMGSMDNISSQE